MDELIDQIRKANEGGLYYLALFGALTLIDICGAVASEKGTSTGSNFKDWLRDNVSTQGPQADMIWGLRCSLLHQGRALPHGGHYPLAFTVPGTTQFHNLSFEREGTDERVGMISVPLFVEEITRGAEAWLRKYGSSATVTRNLAKFARFRPEGIPLFAGPVVA